MIEIPVDHRVTIELPGEIPAGKVILTLTAAPFNSTVCQEEVKAKLLKLRGCLGKNAFGALDGVAYQNKARSEWDG